MKKIFILIILGVLFCPVASAQLHSYGGANVEIKTLVQNIEKAAGLIFSGFAVVMFVMAGILFLSAQGDAAKVAAAKQAFIWGIVGVIVGIIAFSIILLVSTLITGG